MRHPFRKILLLSFLLTPLHTLAAPSDSLAVLSGRVYPADYTETALKAGLGIQYASVVLQYGQDSLAILSGPGGHFSFSAVRPQRVLLKVRRQGFEPYFASIDLVAGDNLIFVPMEPEVLNAAVVTAEADLVRHKGDTIVYNAAAVTVRAGDDAIAILRQLPGAEIRNGKIYIDGKPVVRTYVNGIMVYGDDPMNAMNHLPAEEVLTMNVYDEESVRDKERGIRQGEKERVIDIRTKNALVTAVDIKSVISGGADGAAGETGHPQIRYYGGALADFFSEKTLLSANVAAGNIGMLDNTLSAAIRASRESLKSYQEDIAASAAFEQHWNARVGGDSFRATYQFSRKNNRSSRHTLQDYLATETIPASRYADTARTNDLQMAHNIHTSLSLHPRRVFVIWNNTLSFQDGRSDAENLVEKQGDLPIYQDLIHKSNNLVGSVKEQVSVSTSSSLWGDYPLALRHFLL